MRIALLVLGSAVCAPGAAVAVDWVDGYEEGLRLTREDGRPLFVFFKKGGLEQIDRRHFDDARVLMLLRRFNCVWVDENAPEELFRRFSVGRNPAYIVLNGEEQRIHRWGGWMPAETFARYVEESLERFDRYLQGETWDAVSVGDRDQLEGFDAPEDLRVQGLAVAGGQLWVLQWNRKTVATLYTLDPLSGDVLGRSELPPRNIRAMTADGRYLYLLSYGWTKGDPIYRVDLESRAIVGEIVTEENKRHKAYSSAGIAVDGERLYVSHEWATLSVIDAASGELLRRLRVWWDEGVIEAVGGMEHDGRLLYGVVRAKDGANRDAAQDVKAPTVHGVATIDPDSGRVLDLLPVGFPIHKLTLHEGAFVFADNDQQGHDRQNKPVRSFPPDHIRIHIAYP